MLGNLLSLVVIKSNEISIYVWLWIDHIRSRCMGKNAPTNTYISTPLLGSFENEVPLFSYESSAMIHRLPRCHVTPTETQTSYDWYAGGRLFRNILQNTFATLKSQRRGSCCVLVSVFRQHSTGYPYRLADERSESSEKGNVCVFIVDKRWGEKDSVGKNMGD